MKAVQSYPKSLEYLGGRVGGQVMWYVKFSKHRKSAY